MNKPLFTLDARREEKPYGHRFLVAVLIGLILSVWLCQAGISLKKTLFCSSFYHELLGELEIYPYLKDFFLNKIYRNDDAGNDWGTESIIDRALDATFDEAWMEQQAGPIIEKVFDFAMGKEKRLHLTMDLKDQKEVFKEELLDALRKMSPPELAFLELSETEVKEFIDHLNIPDRLTLIGAGQAHALYEENKEAISFFKNASLFFAFIPYIMLGAMVVLAFFWAGFPRAFKWIGAGMAVSAVTYAALLSALAIPLAKKLAAVKLEILTREIPGIAEAAVEYTRPALLNVAYYYALAGLLVLAAGLIIGKLKDIKR